MKSMSGFRQLLHYHMPTVLWAIIGVAAIIIVTCFPDMK